MLNIILDIYEQIREFLADYIKETRSTGILTEEKVLIITIFNLSLLTIIHIKIIQALQQKGIIDDIVKSINPPKPPPPAPTPTPPQATSPPIPTPAATPTSAPPVFTPQLNPLKRYLYLKVVGGRAFVEHLMTQPEVYRFFSIFFVLSFKKNR